MSGLEDSLDTEVNEISTEKDVPAKRNEHLFCSALLFWARLLHCSHYPDASPLLRKQREEHLSLAEAGT